MISKISRQYKIHCHYLQIGNAAFVSYETIVNLVIGMIIFSTEARMIW